MRCSSRREQSERVGKQALGHNSKAVHHAYSKHAEVTVPALEDWERGWKEKLKAETLKTEIGGQRSEDGPLKTVRLKVERLKPEMPGPRLAVANLVELVAGSLKSKFRSRESGI